LKNLGKPIYDPYEGLPIGVPQERREYLIFRSCGHCGGNGRKKKDPGDTIPRHESAQCSQCILGGHEARRINGKLIWGRFVQVLAIELSDDEMSLLNDELRDYAQKEIVEHEERNLRSRIAADEQNKRFISVVRGFA
jgi:hypothetical protein